MQKVELQSPYTELVFDISANYIVFVDTNFRQYDEIEIKNTCYQIVSVENYSLNTAPLSNFEKIGLKQKHSIIGPFKNYTYFAAQFSFKQEEFIFSVAKISFISLLDFVQLKYELSSQIQFIELVKI